MPRSEQSGSEEGDLPRKRGTFGEAIRQANRCLPGSAALGDDLGDHQMIDRANTPHLVVAEAQRRHRQLPRFLDTSDVPADDAKTILYAIGQAKLVARRRPSGATARALVPVIYEHVLAVNSFNRRAARGTERALHGLNRGRKAEIAWRHHNRHRGTPSDWALSRWRIAAADFASSANADRYLLATPDLRRVLSEREALRLHRDITVRRLATAGASPGLIAGLFSWREMRARVTREAVKKILQRPASNITRQLV